MGPAERVRGPALRGAPVARVVAAVAAVAAGVLLVGSLWVSRREGVPATHPNDVVRIGVVQGQSVPGYLTSSRTELAALADPSAPAAGDTWALVSLDDYRPPGTLPDLLAGTAVAQVYARVPVAGALTQVVRIPVYRLPADVLSGMLDAALLRDRERAEYEQLARRAAGDDVSQARARRAYETAARTAATEAAAYRQGCSCVFAAVVRAAPAALRGVADRSGVRVVDPAPEVRSLDRTEFRPPRPEQTGTVTAEPSRSPTGAVPTGSAGIASRASTPIVSSAGAPVTSASPVVAGRETDAAATVPPIRSAVLSAPDATAAHDAPAASVAAPRAPPGR